MLKPQSITTPIGTSSWCALNPDAPDTKFGAKFYVDLLVPKKNMKEFAKSAKSFLEEARSEFGMKKKVNPLPIKQHVDEDGNETDFLVVKCKLVAEGQKKDGGTYKNKLVLFDCNKKPFVPEGVIGMGTKMRVALNMCAYDVQGVGVTFKISCVQIIDVKYYEGSASADEFEVEEGNTSSTEEEATVFDDTSDEDTFDF
jgi:hypothetical protein